jgi:ATP-binding cassette subfamily A (ABC1) protein 3
VVFFAEFSDATIDFSAVTAERVGATELLNYTKDAIDMYKLVQNVESPSQCCNYSYQILDKFCAKQSVENITCEETGFREKFGYHRCLKCLDCCRASRGTVPSCTNPLSQTRDTDQQDLCPFPPQVSVGDNLTGGLDSETVFVDEFLLRKGNDMAPAVYIRRFQAGFVLSSRDPPYAACGCSNVDFFTQEYIGELSECVSLEGSSVYALKETSEYAQYFHWLSRNCGTSGRGSGSGGEGSGTIFNGDYAVDGTSANFLQLLSCFGNETFQTGCCGGYRGERPPAQYFPEQTPQLSAIIYYNNNPWHMSAAALNAFHNIWLRQATKNTSDLRLIINNHPLPRTVDAEV